MADLPSIYDILNVNFLTQAWTALDGVNRNAAGTLVGALPEAQSANRPTAEWRNGVIGVLRQLSQIHTGATQTTALNIATTLRIPRYTTAGRPAAGTEGRLIHDTDLDILLLDSGAAWIEIGAAVEVADVADTVLYDQDFSTLANNTFADGAEVIGSHTWTAANVAAATIFDIQNGTGMRFDAAASSTAYTTTTRSASNIGIPILTLIPTYDPVRTYVIDAYFTTLTLGVSGNRVLLGLDNNDDGTDRLAGGGPRNPGTAVTLSASTQIEGTIGGSYSSVGHDTFGVRISPDGLTAYSGTYSGGFPTAYARVGSVIQHATGSYSPAMDPTNARFVIAFVTGEAGGAMAATLRRLRIRRIA